MAVKPIKGSIESEKEIKGVPAPDDLVSSFEILPFNG
jgi:hypothetical protein